AFLATGQGVVRNSEEAAQWWLKAAESGEESAQFNLGSAFLLGDGVPKDLKQAYDWIKRSADNGYPLAQISIARFYYEGWNVNRDRAEALKWLTLGTGKPAKWREQWGQPEPPDSKVSLAALALIQQCKAELSADQIKVAEAAANPISHGR
ncbi:MAG TPA: tetratricopeptide repeat protein, partial [Candidatus Saccharimonadales bacterium]|nr:tetratricopeptide repeat protein [Candidatus Saccharimonadales bacterium]